MAVGAREAAGLGGAPCVTHAPACTAASPFHCRAGHAAVRCQAAVQQMLQVNLEASQCVSMLWGPTKDPLTACDAGKASGRCAKCKVQQETAPCTFCRERQKAEEEREARRTARFGESAHARQQRANDAALGGRVRAGRRDFLGYYELLGLNGDGGGGEVVRFPGPDPDRGHHYACPLQCCSCPSYFDLGMQAPSSCIGPGQGGHGIRHQARLPQGSTEVASRPAGWPC